MALSAAEKQRHYRQRRDADPEQREKHKQKMKEKYIDDLKTGKRKLIGILYRAAEKITPKEVERGKKEIYETRKRNRKYINCLDTYC